MFGTLNELEMETKNAMIQLLEENLFDLWGKM